MVWPPGFTVSVLSTARPLADRVTGVLCPDASVPDEGDTDSVPSRFEG